MMSYPFKHLFKWTLIAVTAYTSSELDACPGVTWGKDLKKHLGAAPRNQFQVFTLDKNKQWRTVASQIDPVSGNGKFKFFKDDAWRTRALTSFDRITFDPDEAGPKRSKEPLPCGAKDMVEMSLGSSKFVYGAYCSPSGLTNPPQAKIIHHDAKHALVSSPTYSYSYSPYNHLLFNTLKFSPKGDSNHSQFLGTFSDQYIYGDVKNFFSLTFDAKDFEATINSERDGPVALIGRLTFLLKILMFEIDLELYPEVSFYRNDIHVPMVMHLPVNAYDHLNRGSGLFYTWMPAPQVTWSPAESKMPLYGASTEQALNLCSPSLCHYYLRAKLPEGAVGIDMIVPRPLVKKGFYPQMIWDQHQVELQRNQKISQYAAKDRVGVYFETSQLKKGNHLWDFWLRFGEDFESLRGACEATTQQHLHKISSTP